jgi:long-chain acyl-CoA synthetase
LLNAATAALSAFWFRPSLMKFCEEIHELAPELREHAKTWTQSAVLARHCPDAVAVVSATGSRTHRELNDNVNRLAHALCKRGLGPGSALALLCQNRVEFVEVFLAAMRLGIRLTPINTHLTAQEVRYIVEDCRAEVFIAQGNLFLGEMLPPGVEVLLIGSDEQTNTYEACLGQSRADELSAPRCGTLMLYTSGTTGRPKGVFRREPEVIEPQFEGSFAQYRAGDVALCCGPAYHSAPLLFDIRWPLASGIPILLLEKWNSLEVLRLIQAHRVTHAHMVPTMFKRLLDVDQALRSTFDLSSLRFLVHGAAPCPIAVKRGMIEWLGPVLTEYYAATEGGNGIHVDSQQWLLKPGTVGRLDPSLGHRILNDQGEDVPPGEVGRIHFKAPSTGRFEYFGDPQKTAATYARDLFTLGDLGYQDQDGFLFLTGRAAECIISGGVNIYPREIDEVLMSHPAVKDACTVGAPDDEWGERVVSVVVLHPEVQATPELQHSLSTHAAKFLASFKLPREFVFDESLPYTGTGKLQRNRVRERFWSDRAQRI